MTEYTAPTQTQATYTTPAASNGLGITGLILGIVGILFGLVPLVFFITGPLAVTGLILSLVGRARVKRGEATNGKTALFGIVTSLLAMAMSVWGATIVFGAVDEFDKSMTCVLDAQTAEQIDACE